MLVFFPDKMDTQQWRMFGFFFVLLLLILCCFFHSCDCFILFYATTVKIQGDIDQNRTLCCNFCKSSRIWLRRYWFNQWPQVKNASFIPIHMILMAKSMMIWCVRSNHQCGKVARFMRTFYIRIYWILYCIAIDMKMRSNTHSHTQQKWKKKNVKYQGWFGETDDTRSKNYSQNEMNCCVVMWCNAWFHLYNT